MKCKLNKLGFCTLLLLVGCSILASFAEDKGGYFFRDISENGIPLFKKYQSAVENNDIETALSCYAKLKEIEKPGTFHKLSGNNRISFFEYLDSSFAALGKTAIEKYRERFDPNARNIFEAYENDGNAYHLTRLLDQYPFSTPSAKALLLLAAQRADCFDFQGTISYLKRLERTDPQFFKEEATFKLYARAVITLDEDGELEYLRALSKKYGMESTAIGDIPILDYLNKGKAEILAKQQGSWNQPFGNHSRTRTIECTVTNPEILWRSIPESLTDSSFSLLKEEFVLEKKQRIKSNVDFYILPAIRKDSAFLFEDDAIVVRNLDCGLEISREGSNVNSYFSPIFGGVTVNDFFADVVPETPSSYRYENDQPEEVLPFLFEDGSPKNKLDVKAAGSICTCVLSRDRCISLESHYNGMIDIYLSCYSSSENPRCLWRSLVCSKSIDYSSNEYKMIPAIGEGKVFFYVMDYLGAADIVTGKVLWLRELKSMGQTLVSKACSLHYFSYHRKLVLVNDIPGNYIAFDPDTGSTLWKQSKRISRYLGAIDGKLYIFQSRRVWTIDISDGNCLQLGERIPLRCLGGFVTRERIYLVSANKLQVYNAQTLEKISEVELNGLTASSSPLIAAVGNRIVISSPNGVSICLGEKEEINKDFENAVKADESNPVPYFQAGMRKYYAENMDEALKYFSQARERLSEDSEQFGMKIADIMDRVICDEYMIKILSTDEDDDIEGIVERGVSLLQGRKEKARLKQFLVNRYLKKRDFEPLIMLLVDELKSDVLGDIYANVRMLRAAQRFGIEIAFKEENILLTNMYHLMLRELGDIRRAERCIGGEIRKLKDKVLAGDEEAATTVFRVLWSNELSKEIAAELAWKVLNGTATPGEEKSAFIAATYFPIRVLPELGLVRAKNMEHVSRAIAARIVQDVLDEFPQHKLSYGEPVTTLESYALQMLPKDNEQRLEKKKVAEVEGYVEAFEDRNEMIKGSIAYAECKAGIVVRESGTCRWRCLSLETEEEVWARSCEEKMYSIGVWKCKKNADGEYEVYLKDAAYRKIDPGFENGDIILSVKSDLYDEKVNRLEDFLKSPGNSPVTFTFRHGGEIKTTTVVPYESGNRWLEWCTKLPGERMMYAMWDDRAASFHVIDLNSGEELASTSVSGRLRGKFFYRDLVCCIFETVAGRDLVVLDKSGEVQLRKLLPEDLSIRALHAGKLIGSLKIDGWQSEGCVVVDILTGRISAKHCNGLHGFYLYRVENNVALFNRGRTNSVYLDLFDHRTTWLKKPWSMDGMIEKSHRYFDVASKGKDIEYTFPVGFWPDQMYTREETVLARGYFSLPRRKSSTRRGGHSLFCFDRKTGNLLWRRKATPNRIIEDNGAIIQARSVNGKPVYSFTRIGEPLAAFDTEWLKDLYELNTAIFVRAEQRRIYRPIRESDRKLIRSKCEAFLAQEKPDIEEAKKLADKLLLARMYPELLRVADFMLTRHSYLLKKPTLKAKFAYVYTVGKTYSESEDPQFGVQKLETFSADGSFEEWDSNGWQSFPTSSKAFYKDSIALASDEDLSAQFQLGLSEERFCIAVRVKDDALDALEVSHEALHAKIGFIEKGTGFPILLLNLKARKDENGQVKLTCFYGTEKSEIFEMNPEDNVVGIQRDEENKYTCYELAIDKNYLVRSLVDAGLVSSRKLDKQTLEDFLVLLRFSIGVSDSDPGENGVKYIELSPAFFCESDLIDRYEANYPRVFLKRAE